MLGGAGSPVTVASLPARGRPPQAAARRAGLEFVEKLLTSPMVALLEFVEKLLTSPMVALLDGAERWHASRTLAPSHRSRGEVSQVHEHLRRQLWRELDHD
jgi:hypothetical protein